MLKTVSSWTLAASLSAAAPAVLAQPLDCTIQPSLSVEITSSVEGILDEVLVAPGDRIGKGEVLARLAADVERTSLEIAEARAQNHAAEQSALSRYEFYKAKLDRAQELIERQLIPSEELERAQTEFIIAENDLENARTELRFAALDARRAKALLDLKTLRSPFDAVVVRQHLDPGSLVANQAVILELARLDPLKVRTFAPVELFPLVRSSERATVWPQPPFEVPMSAEIRVVDTVFDIASGTFGVELTLPNPDFGLPAGLKCKIEFEAMN